MKTKLIIDNKLFIDNKNKYLLEKDYDLYYFSTNKDENDSDLIQIDEHDLMINNIDNFYNKLALTTKTINIEDIIFVSDDKALLSLLGNLNFNTLLIYNPKYDCNDFEATYEVSNINNLYQLLEEIKNNKRK